MPGTFFTEDFGVRLQIRPAGIFGFRIKDNAVVLQLELMGFEFIIGIFDEKIQATAYRALHFTFGVWFLVFSVWCRVSRIRPGGATAWASNKTQNTKHQTLEEFCLYKFLNLNLP